LSDPTIWKEKARLCVFWKIVFGNTLFLLEKFFPGFWWVYPVIWACGVLSVLQKDTKWYFSPFGGFWYYWCSVKKNSVFNLLIGQESLGTYFAQCEHPVTMSMLGGCLLNRRFSGKYLIFNVQYFFALFKNFLDV
jgi:hypothetical protein